MQLDFAADNLLSVCNSVVSITSPSLQVLAVFTGRGGSTAGFVDSADADAGTVGIVLSDTSFYYESGGQVFDTGALQLHTADGEFAFVVEVCCALRVRK